jgi:predicted alpha/beta superfamily hydrolase
MTPRLLGNPDAATMLVQMVDDHDLALIENEYRTIASSCPGRDFSLLTVKVDAWDHDLSPWTAPPVFGKTPFGDGAPQTLSFLLDSVIPRFSSGRTSLYLGGYSLAGLFALWAACNCSLFKGVAAASPSVWFPGFVDYCKANPPQTGAVYLSLGDKEEKTRNPVMATVGESVKRIYSDISSAGIPCTFEWNEGNHFRDPDLRMAKGFSWLLNREWK